VVITCFICWCLTSAPPCSCSSFLSYEFFNFNRNISFSILEINLRSRCSILSCLFYNVDQRISALYISIGLLSLTFRFILLEVSSCILLNLFFGYAAYFLVLCEWHNYRQWV
jgi:hypothetical protein